MQSLADSHATLAARMESDVERPLKEYQTKNREMQAMSTIQGNLASVAKEVEVAQRKASKLSGGKTSANKVANATSDVEAANQQWESQAPYVFEQLQSLDESRINHLRDALTQLETHEVDLVERNRVNAESCLNALLNVDTSDEISTFVARISGGPTADPPRLASRGGTPAGPERGPMANPPPMAPRAPSAASTPSRREDNSDVPTLHHSSSKPASGPPTKSGFGGLRRLGTVLGGRSKGAKGMDRPPSPEKRTRPMRNPLRRGASSTQNMQTLDSPPPSSTHLPLSPPRHQQRSRDTTSTQSNDRPLSPPEPRRREDQPNGDPTQQAPTRGSSLPMANGTTTDTANHDLAPVQESGFAPPPGPPLGKNADAPDVSLEVANGNTRMLTFLGST